MDEKVAGLGRPIITVVQPAQSILGKHATRVYAASSPPRRSLAQPKMRAVFVMIGNILTEHPLQMAFIDRDNVIQQVAAAAADPTLGDTISAMGFRTKSELDASSGIERPLALPIRTLHPDRR